MYYEVIKMSISIRVSEKESKLIKKYAELNGTTVSEVMRQAILSKIEMSLIYFFMNKLIKNMKKIQKHIP